MRSDVRAKTLSRPAKWKERRESATGVITAGLFTVRNGVYEYVVFSCWELCRLAWISGIVLLPSKVTIHIASFEESSAWLQQRSSISCIFVCAVGSGKQLERFERFERSYDLNGLSRIIGNLFNLLFYYNHVCLSFDFLYFICVLYLHIFIPSLTPYTQWWRSSWHYQ